MNIAIIGCGYVGYAVAQHWQKMPFTITATTTTPERVPSLQAVAQQVVVVKGSDKPGTASLRERDSLKSVVQDKDIVLLSVGAKGADNYEEAYLHTAQTLIDVLQQTPTVRQLIYTGSYSVYGDKNGEWVDEESLVEPVSKNGQILRDTEQVLLSTSGENLRVCVLRLGGIYGPDRELIELLDRFSGTTRPGNGEDVTNWIHLDDIVGAIEFAREHQLQGIYNLVDDAHLISRELYHRLFEAHNLPKVTWDSSQQSKRPYNVRVSNEKIKKAGYKLIHPDMIFI